MNLRTGSGARSRTELCYGECNGGLTFLERSYATKIGDFRAALSESSTWGELKSKVAEEYYLETVERWKEEEFDRLTGEGDEEPQEVPSPKPEDAFGAADISGYLDMDWPEFAPAMMDEWVSKEIIEQYGGYVQPTLNDDYPLIDFENEEKVVSLLEEQGYVCVRDDALIWRAIFGE